MFGIQTLDCMDLDLNTFSHALFVESIGLTTIRITLTKPNKGVFTCVLTKKGFLIQNEQGLQSNKMGCLSTLDVISFQDLLHGTWAIQIGLDPSHVNSTVFCECANRFEHCHNNVKLSWAKNNSLKVIARHLQLLGRHVEPQVQRDDGLPFIPYDLLSRMLGINFEGNENICCFVIKRVTRSCWSKQYFGGIPPSIIRLVTS